MHEEISLTEEDERALDRAWDEISRIEEQKKLEQSRIPPVFKPNSGAIFIIGADSNLTEMKEAEFTNEQLLQELIAKYPDLLAGNQMNPEKPRKWILVSREVGIQDQAEIANYRWSLDHLYLDQDGIPTLVEVKRSSDTRLRREVVGQMLDYAANASSYWNIQDLRNYFEQQYVDNLELGDAQLLELIGPNIAVDDFWSSVKVNLQAGRIRMVFLADEIPNELRTIVEFLNRQMDPAEVLAVELRHYVDPTNKIKTLVPTVIGTIPNVRSARTSITAPAATITKNEFISTIEEQNAPSRLEAVRRIIDWAENNKLGMTFRRGVRDTVCIPEIKVAGKLWYPFSCKHIGQLVLQMRYMVQSAPFDNPKLLGALEEMLAELPGFNKRGGMNGLPILELDQFKTDADRDSLISVMDWIRKQLESV